MSCRTTKSDWYDAPAREYIADGTVVQWNIDERTTASGRRLQSIALAIIGGDDNKFDVVLLNGAFAGNEPTLGEFYTRMEAVRYANAFMKDFPTWAWLKEYFDTRGWTEMWNDMYEM